MTESNSPSQPELEQHLRTLADRLREADHLEADARGELASLLDEMSHMLASAPLSAEAREHLLASAAHLADALEQQPPHGLFAAAGERLERTVLLTQSRAPVLAGITRRLIDVLTNIGI